MSVNYFLRLNRILVFIGLLSLCIISDSYFAETMQELQACSLCKLQRIPYMCAIVFALYGFLTARKILALRLMQLAFTLGFFLAIFHTSLQSAEIELLFRRLAFFDKLLRDEAFCSTVSWEILGMPASLGNILASFLFAFFLQWEARRISYLTAE